MTDVQRKMMFGNASSMMDISERPASINDWTIQRCTKELALHSADFVHRDVFKKRS